MASSTFTQAHRIIGVETPLGADVLQLRSFTGAEGISRLFHFRLDLYSEPTVNVSPKALLGEKVDIRVKLFGGSDRWFNGVCSSFSFVGQNQVAKYYTMDVVPKLWLLSRKATCKVWAHKTVKDILSEVFGEFGLNFRFVGSAGKTKLDYCTQYRETSLNFVSRLMEHHGIFYFFEHSKGNHQLVLGTDTSAHKSCPGQASAKYDPVSLAPDDEDVVTDFAVSYDLKPSHYRLRGFDYKQYENTSNDVPTKLSKQNNNSAHEIYDYVEEMWNTGDLKDILESRAKEEEAGAEVGRGGSSCRQFTSGAKFALKEHPNAAMNGDYLLTEVYHSAVAEASSGYTYKNTFTCIPAAVQYRPPRVTPKPIVQGPHSGIVTSKVDKLNRIQVTFPWMKEKQNSCRIRIGQFWAGNGFGAFFIPRVKHEVIVEFLSGDPDKPIIVGSVYNGKNEYPYSLPGEDHYSGIQTRTLDDSKGHYNELRFSDKAGSEEIYVQAEKDMNTLIKHDETRKVKNDRTTTITKDETLKVETGNRDEEISLGNDTLKVKMGNKKIDVGQNFDSTAKVGITFTCGASKIAMTPGSIDISCGASKISMNPAMMTIQAPLVKIN